MNEPPWPAARVAYFGDPRGALALLSRGVPLCGVVHGRTGGPGWTRLLPKLTGIPRLRLPDLREPEVVAQIAGWRPTLIVASFYPRRIPATVLALAPGLNVHPSDLPRWRGPDPCAWTIRAGDTRTAVCVQWLAIGLDEGDVLVREPVALDGRETAGKLADRLEARGAELIADVAVRILWGEAFVGTPQTGEVTWAPLLAPEEAELDFARSAVEVHRFVRAADPVPGAFTGLGDANELLVLHDVEPVDAGRFATLPAGTPYVRAGETYIRCGEGAIRLKRVTLGRRRLTGRRLAELLA